MIVKSKAGRAKLMYELANHYLDSAEVQIRVGACNKAKSNLDAAARNIQDAKEFRVPATALANRTRVRATRLKKRFVDEGCAVITRTRSASGKSRKTKRSR